MAGAQTSGGRGALVEQPDAGKKKEVEATLQAMEKANEKILAAGQEAPAKVVLSTWMGVNVNGNNPLTHFMLEVMPQGREVFRAEATAIIAEASVSRYEPGQTITVKFDPEDLTRVAILHS